MKTKRLLLPLLCLCFLLPLSVIAQEIEIEALDNDLEQQPRASERIEELMVKRINEIMVSRITRAVFEEDPSGFFMLTLTTEGGSILPGFNEEFGITEEQVDHLKEVMSSLEPENIDEFQEMLEAMAAKIAGSPDYELTDEEDEALESMIKYALEAANISAAEALTEEQIQKMDGMMLALTGGLESPFFNERHMDAIDMTDEQKEQFKKIDEATKPGREKLIAAISEETLKMMESEQADFKGLLAVFSKFREYSVDLKQRRMAVLTPAQMAKAANLARLPKFLSPFNLLRQWVPGPNSWKPGDPLPKQYRQERKTRRGFPREE